MNKIDNGSLQICLSYLSYINLDFLRQCSKYLSLIVGCKYFKYQLINIDKINNKLEFLEYVNRYKVSLLCIKNVMNMVLLHLKLEGFIIIQIQFANHFNQIITKNMLPNTLKYLTFGKHFNRKIRKDTLPNGLLSLTFGNDYCHEPVRGSLPTTLQHLIFGDQFGGRIMKGILPDGLLSLTFGLLFINPIHELPSSLINLTFGENFNQPIGYNVLPLTLKKLVFGANFNQPIEEILPESLEILVLGNDFNQPINSLPPRLKYLKFNTHSSNNERIDRT
jgi:hypothetical protein